VILFKYVTFNQFCCKFAKGGDLMFEKIEKEKLTNEIILKDILYNKKMHKTASNVIIDFFILYGSLYITLHVFLITSSPFVFFLLLFPAGYIIIKWSCETRERKKLTCADFYVDTDKLTSIKGTYCGSGGSKYRTMFTCYFEGGSEWEVPLENYKWSKTYRLSREGINYTSLQGDTFYIVRLNSTGNVVVAYNTKFFEYKKD
jgi:hypothetical protein